MNSSNFIGPIKSGPINDTLPTVSGTAKVNQTLSSTNGAGRSRPTGYTRAWQREVGGVWTAIPGATGTTYTVTTDDLGLRLRIAVTATNANGSTVATSDPTAAVTPLVPPVNTAAPVVTGTAQQGQTLTVGSDTWTGMQTTSVVWQRRPAGGSWTTISGATARTYVPVAADVDGDLRALVTAANADGTTEVASAARGPVLTNVPPANSVLPAITGTPAPGRSSPRRAATWVRATSYGYVWQRLSGGTWSPISGATASTYTPVSADAGKPVRVVVTATGPRRQHARHVGADRRRRRPAREPVRAGDLRHGQARPHADRRPRAPGRTPRATRTPGSARPAAPGATSARRPPRTCRSPATSASELRVRVTASNATGQSPPAVSARHDRGRRPRAAGRCRRARRLRRPLRGRDADRGRRRLDRRDADRRAVAAPPGRRQLDRHRAAPTARTYTLVAADRDADIRAVVTASNDDGDHLAGLRRPRAGRRRPGQHRRARRSRARPASASC